MSRTPIETWSNMEHLLTMYHITGYVVKGEDRMLSTPKPVTVQAMRSAVRTTLIPAPRDDLCLAFANTLSWRGSPMPSESLAGVEDLLEWLRSTGKVPAESIEAASKRLRRYPNEAAALFTDAIGFRETLYRIFSALASGGPVADHEP